MPWNSRYFYRISPSRQNQKAHRSTIKKVQETTTNKILQTHGRGRKFSPVLFGKYVVTQMLTTQLLAIAQVLCVVSESDNKQDIHISLRKSINLKIFQTQTKLHGKEFLIKWLAIVPVPNKMLSYRRETALQGAL